MKQFNEWMDARGMTPNEAASKFGKSAGTIRNWRSIGVPQNLQDWVLARMGEIDSSSPVSATSERVSLEITREQFTSWNRAALLEGKIIYDWAADVLDDAAADTNEDSTGSHTSFNPLASLKVADRSTEYLPPKDDAV
jgi:hypothetical protein